MKRKIFFIIPYLILAVLLLMACNSGNQTTYSGKAPEGLVNEDGEVIREGLANQYEEGGKAPEGLVNEDGEVIREGLANQYEEGGKAPEGLANEDGEVIREGLANQYEEGGKALAGFKNDETYYYGTAIIKGTGIYIKTGVTLEVIMISNEILIHNKTSNTLDIIKRKIKYDETYDVNLPEEEATGKMTRKGCLYEEYGIQAPARVSFDSKFIELIPETTEKAFVCEQYNYDILGKQIAGPLNTKGCIFIENERYDLGASELKQNGLDFSKQFTNKFHQISPINGEFVYVLRPIVNIQESIKEVQLTDEERLEYSIITTDGKMEFDFGNVDGIDNINGFDGIDNNTITNDSNINDIMKEVKDTLDDLNNQVDFKQNDGLIDQYELEGLTDTEQDISKSIEDLLN